MSRDYLRALTPKEFTSAIGDVLHVNTVRDRCKRGEIATIGGAGRPPYLIPPASLVPYRLSLSRFLIS